MPAAVSVPRRADRRSTSLQVTWVKSAPTRVLPVNRTRDSAADPKSASRSTQSSKVTSVSLQSRKFTESSLQPRSSTRRQTQENACTPASTQPLSQASVSDDSAMSTATRRVSPNHTSVSRARRSRAPSNPVPPVNAHSANRARSASAPSKEAPSNRRRSYSPSVSRSPSKRLSSDANGR